MVTIATVAGRTGISAYNLRFLSLIHIFHELSFFIQGSDGKFTRKDEVHEERTYPIDDYLARLATAGFKEAMVCADFTDEAPSEESARWFFVCKK